MWLVLSLFGGKIDFWMVLLSISMLLLISNLLSFSTFYSSNFLYLKFIAFFIVCISGRSRFSLFWHLYSFFSVFLNLSNFRSDICKLGLTNFSATSTLTFSISDATSLKDDDLILISSCVSSLLNKSDLVIDWHVMASNEILDGYLTSSNLSIELLGLFHMDSLWLCTVTS